METGKPTKQANPLSPAQMSSQLLFVIIRCFTDKIASFIAATAPDFLFIEVTPVNMFFKV